MSSRGAGLVIGGGAVVVMAIILVIWMRSGGDPAATEAAPPAGEPAATSAAPAIASPKHATVEPALPRPDDGSAAAPAYREYAVGDRLVRDHRKGDKPPVDIPPSVHRPEGRRLAPSVTHAVGQQLKVVVTECAASLPAEARGAKPRLEGQVVIAIKDKQLTVKSSVVQVRDVAADAGAAIKQCIEQKATSVAHAADEADLESYDMNVSYGL